MSDDGSEEFPEEGTNLGTYEGDRNEADERFLLLNLMFNEEIVFLVVKSPHRGLLLYRQMKMYKTNTFAINLP